MFDYDVFLSNVTKKAETNGFEQNVDFMLVMCMRDMRNYKYYITKNETETSLFSVCYEAFAHIIMNRDDMDKIDTDGYCKKCNDFLELLQEDDLEFFDECVNITCEMMHLLAYIKTKDKRNVVAAIKLIFESAESHFQKCEMSENEYELKIEQFAHLIENFDISGLNSFLSYN